MLYCCFITIVGFITVPPFLKPVCNSWLVPVWCNAWPVDVPGTHTIFALLRLLQLDKSLPLAEFGFVSIGMSVLCGIFKMCGNVVQNCLKPTTPLCSTGFRTHGWCHSVGNLIEIGNRNTSDIKIAAKSQFIRENIRYVHFAEICEICGNRILA